MPPARPLLSAPELEPEAPPQNVDAVADPATIMARATGENFPVAAPWLPQPARDRLRSIYGFARLVDELGDAAPGDRLAALDWLEAELDRAFAGQPSHPLMRPLAVTIAECELGREPFARLIEANRRDQQTFYYDSFEDLLGYCDLSANPVGELVLEVFGLATKERVALSNAVCSALQLIEHWQDVREDLALGRVYVPLADLARFGCSLDELRAPRVGERLRRVLVLEATRTSALLEEGRTLVGTLRGWPRLAVAGYVGGGRAALSALARADYEVLAQQPRPSRRRTVGSILRALSGAPR
jgi:squalene synthase HpnC